MGEKLKTAFLPNVTEKEAGNYSPLVLAFLGDSVYETAVRTMLINEGQKPVNVLNHIKTGYVKAHAQSEMMEVILPELTPEEESIYRRGRNAKSATMAKNASMADYRRATGFEALMGYLYLAGRQERMYALMEKGVLYYEENFMKPHNQ